MFMCNFMPTARNPACLTFVGKGGAPPHRDRNQRNT